MSKSNPSWREAVEHALSGLGGQAKPKEIADYIARHKLRHQIANPEATVRRTLQNFEGTGFIRMSPGLWKLASGQSGRSKPNKKAKAKKRREKPSASSWRESVETALKAKGGEAHYIDIAEYIMKKGLRPRIGHPNHTVNRTLQDAEGSLFERLGAGVWALKGKRPRAVSGKPNRSIVENLESAPELPVKGLYLLVNLKQWFATANDGKTHVLYLGKAGGQKGIQGRLYQYGKGQGVTGTVKAWFDNPNTVMIPLPVRLTGNEEEQAEEIARLEKAFLRGFQDFYGSRPPANGQS